MASVSALKEDSVHEIPLMAEYGRAPEEDAKDLQLDSALVRLESFLRVFSFCQYSALSSSLSWLVFILVAFLLPFSIIQFSSCSNCRKYQMKGFELYILTSQVVLAAVSLLIISHNIRKHRVRKFLFVDRNHGCTPQLHQEYLKKIGGFYGSLVTWILPCLVVKSLREIAQISYTRHGPWWRLIISLFALLVSWIYTTTVYLSSSALFSLVCNLQLEHLENYGKLLERNEDVSVLIGEHIRVSRYVSKISHRFRVYLLLVFLLVTASQIIILVLTTKNEGILNFVNGGDFVVASTVQLVGIVVCLHAAAKISHRAQSVWSVASTWHAVSTCGAVGAHHPSSGFFLDLGTTLEHSPTSGTDMDSFHALPIPPLEEEASRLSSYHKRQSFLVYLQSNSRGITVYGWTIDRTLATTMFFICMSLVLFVLGKTLTF